MLEYEEQLAEIVKIYKDGDDEALDGDEVDRLVEHFRNKLNYMEGNITLREYEKSLEEWDNKIAFKSNYQKGFELLMEYFDNIPEDERTSVDDKLKEMGL